MADNKKIYSIQINGIDQSIKQVDALSDALKFLDNKIKELESRSVSVTSTQSGNGNRNADLQTEDKLLKQIQSTEQQIRDARREDYASLLAQKDILKDIVDETKQRAAQERLSVGNYGNTMKGLKQELSDIKSVMQTTDLGSDKFDELTKRAGELTNKLKDLEQAYGQFGRNVGNYKSAFDDIKKVTVQVGNTAREFNSVRDASRQLTQELKAMAIAGKEGTKEYDELAEAVHNFEMASKRAESAVNDLKASSQGMDDILDMFESFTALGSISQGFSAFFGIDDTEIQRSIQKLVALQNVMQGIEKIRQQMNTQEGIGAIFAKGSAGVDNFVAKLTGAQVTMNGLTASSKAATVAVRGLSMALKAIGVGLAIGAITLAIDAISKIGSEMDNTAKKAQALDEKLKTLNQTYKDRMDITASAYMSKQLSDEQFLAESYKNQNDYLLEQISLLKERATASNMENTPSFRFMDNYSTGGGFTGQKMTGTTTLESYNWWSSLNPALTETVHNIQEVEEEFKKCQEAFQNGKDYFDQWGTGVQGWVNSLFATVGDTERMMRDLGNIKLSDFVGSFEEVQQQFKEGQINAEEYARKIGELKKEMNSNEVLQSVLANLDKYIPDEKVREAVNNIIGEIARLDDAFNMTSEAQIHHWNQVRIDAMAEGNAKIAAQNEENRRHEIAQYGKTQEQIDMINAKYNRQRLNQQQKYNEQAKNKAKQHARELENAEKELQTLRIQNMAEGLDKQLALLEEERRQKIAKAKENGVKVGEITEEVNKLYDKKVLEAKEKWAYQIEQVYINMWNKIYQINHQNAQMDFENQLRDMENNYQKLQDAAARNAGTATQDYSNQGVIITKTPSSKKNVGSTDSSDYDYKVLIEKDIEYTKRLREEFKSRTEARKQYYAEVEKLTIEEENKRYQIEVQKAAEAKNNELRNLQNSYSAQDHEMQEHYKKGEITLSQYNEAVKRLNEERAEQEAQIQIKYNTEAEERARQHNKNIVNTQNESNTAILNNYQDMMEKLNSIDSSEVVTNGIGFLNITATKKRNKELIDAYKQLSDNLTVEINKLEEQLKSNDLTAEQKKQIEQLIAMYNQLQVAIGGTIINIQNNTKEATQQFISECNMYFQEFASTLQTVLQALWDGQDQAYEKEMEELDKTIDAAREKYQEMDELANEHKSTMEGLEDDIAHAQGDARDHLIQRYNAEKEAMKQALNEKKKAEKEEEKLQAKKEKMEIEQKKREKKRNLVTAAINTAMAISMAAVNSWPVPAIPMMAAAAVAGAAQIAAIASQNYAHGGQLDGGVAQGNRHRDGGIKVLGGHAEIEGGEFVTNRLTTSKNIDLLEYINSKKKRININDLIEFYGGDSPVKKNIQNVRTRFAEGGVIPTLATVDTNDRLLTVIEDYSNRPVQVAVVDIIDRTEQVNNVKVIAGLDV